MSDTDPTYLTPLEAARLLRVPTARLLRLARQGRVPAIRMPDGSWLFSRQGLDDWLLALAKPARAPDDPTAG